MPGMDWRVLAASLAIVFPTASAQAYVNNQSAEIVIGQPDMISNSSGTNNKSLKVPASIHKEGTRLFIADYGNHRILMYNNYPTANHVSADIVIGQPDMSSNSSGHDAKKFTWPTSVCSDGIKMIVADSLNNRVLIFNSIPTENYVSADVVIGQPDMTSNSPNADGVKANTLYRPYCVYYDRMRLIIADMGNSRVLIYNTIPTTNYASADIVIGQPNMTSNDAGLNDKALEHPGCAFSDGIRLFVVDTNHSRVLIFNTIPTTNYIPADVVIGQPDLWSTGGE